MAELTLKQVLELEGLTPHKSSTDKEIHYGCPVCGSTNDPDSDRLRLAVALDKVTCRQCGGGANYPIGYLQWRYGKDSWRQHAERLGIKPGGNNGASPAINKTDLSKAPSETVTIVTPPDLADTPPPTKATYTDLGDFCETKVGIPLWYAQKELRWAETIHGGEVAVKMKMDDGSYRVRPLNSKTFIQIRAPENKDKKTNPPAWYMFPDDDKTLIVLCNGQTSVGAAKFHNIDAFCFTEGEKAIPKPLLKRLQARFNANSDTVCVIALDGDNTGRKATKAIERQLAGLPIRVVDFGGQNGYDLGDFCKKNTSKSLQKLIALSRVPDSSQVVSSTEASKNTDDRIMGVERFPPRHEYIPVPFKSFHHFGGMMRVLHPKKVVVIGTISGGGKTSFAETWVDHFLRLGFDVLWRGDEWTQEEYDVRRKQRYGGLTLDQYADNEMWKTEESLGVPIAQRSGVKLPDIVKTRSLQEGKTIKSWPGKCWYFPERKTVEETQDEMISILNLLRRENRRPALIVWDYLSSFKSESTDENNQAEAVMHSIKAFTNKTGLATLALSQIKKSTEDRIKAGEDVHLSSSDLYYVRPDKANLILGLVPIYTKQPDPSNNNVLTMQPTNNVRAEILKNSLGKPYGHVMLKAKLSRLAFEEYNLNP
jgi:hypothetical protein